MAVLVSCSGKCELTLIQTQVQFINLCEDVQCAAFTVLQLLLSMEMLRVSYSGVYRGLLKDSLLLLQDPAVVKRWP